MSEEFAVENPVGQLSLPAAASGQHPIVLKFSFSTGELTCRRSKIWGGDPPSLHNHLDNGY